MTVAKVEDDEPSLSESMAVNGHVEQESEDIELKSVVTDTIPSSKEQWTIIHDAIKEPLIVGELWYLLDIHWYKQWKKYVDPENNTSNEHEHPGPIDNSSLFERDSMKLREHLLDRSDYKLISKTGWEYLVQWYPLVPEQEPIARKVIEHGLYVKEIKVEVYLTEIKMCTFRDLEKVEVYEFSKLNTIADVVNKTKTLFEIDADEETRVWNKCMPQTYESFQAKLEMTLQDCSIGSGQVITGRFFDHWSVDYSQNALNLFCNHFLHATCVDSVEDLHNEECCFHF